MAGDVQAMRRASALSGRVPAWPVGALSDPAQALSVPPGCLPVFQIGQALGPVAYGHVSAAAGRFAGQCVQWAAQEALQGNLAGLVTAPLHKQALSEAGPPFDSYPGHTEMLQALAAAHAGVGVEQMPVRMMLANPQLRVVLVRHAQCEMNLTGG